MYFVLLPSTVLSWPQELFKLKLEMHWFNVWKTSIQVFVKMLLGLLGILLDILQEYFNAFFKMMLLELAQAMVDAGAVPLLVLCVQEPDLALERISASALSDIAKHSPEV